MIHLDDITVFAKLFFTVVCIAVRLPGLSVSFIVLKKAVEVGDQIALATVQKATLSGKQKARNVKEYGLDGTRIYVLKRNCCCV